jgi:hypothetical protein
MTVALVLAHPSSSAPGAPVALVAQDLVGQVPGDPVVVLVVPEAPAAPVVLEPTQALRPVLLWGQTVGKELPYL